MEGLLAQHREARLERCRPTFLDLPRELRDHIYELALVSDDAISVLNLTNARDSLLSFQRLGLAPAFLMTCKTVCREAIRALYGLNTFQVVVLLNVRHAQRWQEVHKASDSLHVPLDLDILRSAGINGSTPSLRYLHPNVRLIRRLEFKIETLRPSQIHWRNSQLFNAIQSECHFSYVCRTFVEYGSLDLCIFSTDGYGGAAEWMPFGAAEAKFAKALHACLRSCHEWYFERALLAAARQKGTFWINDRSLKRVINTVSNPEFHNSMRRLTHEARQSNDTPGKVVRDLPKRFESSGQLGRCASRGA